MNYYNEIDPFAAKWLRELIKAGHISPGEVDERSIEDVKPNDLSGFRQCHFFAGVGVWSYSLRQAGWEDDRPVWTGSAPCQPFSAAGKRGGVADERHLWPAQFHLLAECRPVTFFGEQVASKDGLAWFDIVQTDLENAMYTVGKADLCAAGFGAPHIRQRLYFVAHTDDERSQRRLISGNGSDKRIAGESGLVKQLAHPDGRHSSAEGLQRSGEHGLKSENRGVSAWSECDWLPCIDGKARPVEPGTFPLAHGIANRVGRLRGYGNALCAPVAQAFIEAYLESEG